MELVEKLGVGDRDHVSESSSDIKYLHEYCRGRVVDRMVALLETWGASPTQSLEKLDQVAQRVRDLRDDIDILRHVALVMERRTAHGRLPAMSVETQDNASQDLPDPSSARAGTHV